MRVLEKRNHYENRTEVIIYLQNRANNNTGRIKGSYAKYEMHMVNNKHPCYYLQAYDCKLIRSCQDVLLCPLLCQFLKYLNCPCVFPHTLPSPAKPVISRGPPWSSLFSSSSCHQDCQVGFRDFPKQSFCCSIVH